MSARCPLCGNPPTAGLFAAFLVSLDKDGNPVGQWSDYESSTELTYTRYCGDCDQTFDLNDPDAAFDTPQL